ncbi:hypothetical protein QOZ80_3AG0244650 [Eleusine coracana subsp. coracana]|nr:hypothetical protein QOZ80_3AG0244650 [Eleusine coracana subsp. coracana]
MRLTGDQIGNHVRTRKRKYAKIYGLIRLSGALWEEDTCIIRRDHEHYTGHIKDHKADAEYLNKPIEHYGEMFTIFGNSLVTGKFAKGSSEPLGTQVTENEDECDEVYVSAAAATPVHEDNGATSSAPKPKKAKTSHNEEEGGLIVTFKGVGEMLAEAIIKSTTSTSDVSPDLYETLQSLPSFDVSHVDDYFDYFVEHPSKVRAFMQLSFDRKLSRFVNFISKQEK